MTWDYIAGFTDGEGWIGVSGRGPRVTWGQNHGGVLDSIQMFLALQGFSPWRSVIAAAPPRRPNLIHMLTISQRADCERLVRILRPRLVVKVAACDRLLYWLKEHPAQKNFRVPDEERIRSLIAQGYDWPALCSRLSFGTRKLQAFCRAHDIPSPAATRRARQAFYEESLARP